MIVFQLRCGQDHEFEAWFRDGATFDAQAAAGEVTCPMCGDTEVEKAPMAPRINKGSAAPVRAQQAQADADTASTEDAGADQAPNTPSDSKSVSVPEGAKELARAEMAKAMREMARLRTALHHVKKVVEENFENVGDGFPAEARKIHHGEAEERPIYGNATDAEAEELADEGVPVARLPWPGRSDA